jgi:hypothetical protein
MLQNVKKVLANPEPSTHDPQQNSRSGCLFFRTAYECSITTQCLRSPTGRIESWRRGAVFERSRIRRLSAHRMAQTALSNLSGAMATQYRDDRLKVVKPPTVRRELVILRHVFEVARREWGLPLNDNPVRRIRLPCSMLDVMPRP